MTVRPRWAIVARDAEAAGLALLVLVAFVALARHDYFGDEPLHADEIRNFVQGNFSLNPFITQLPGYHGLIAALAWAAGSQELWMLRLLSTGLSLLLLPVAFFVARTWHRDGAIARTLQVFFLPILFPILFLVYTDTLALTCAVLALALAWKNRPLLAALAGFGGVLVRQSNILWFLLPLVLLVARRELVVGPIIAFDDERMMIRATVDARLGRWMRAVWPYAIGCALFAGFVVINGGVALGDQTAHPFPSFHLGNVYFALALASAFFFPFFAANAPRVWGLIRRHPILVPLLVLVCYVVFLLTFRVDHPYNQESHIYFLRNRILLLARASFVGETVMYALVAFAALSFWTYPLRAPVFAWLFPFALLSLSAEWLIEQRYSFIPFALFLLVRTSGPRWAERATVALFIMLSLLAVWGIAGNRFFL